MILLLNVAFYFVSKNACEMSGANGPSHQRSETISPNHNTLALTITDTLQLQREQDSLYL